MPERLISTDTVKKAYIDAGATEAEMVFESAFIDSIPTVDAVRVVRCKDCIWFEPKHILHNDGTVTYVAEDAENVTSDVGINCQATCRRYSYIKNWFVSDSGNDYCSRGEKMDGEKGETE